LKRSFLTQRWTPGVQLNALSPFNQNDLGISTLGNERPKYA